MFKSCIFMNIPYCNYKYVLYVCRSAFTFAHPVAAVGPLGTVRNTAALEQRSEGGAGCTVVCRRTGALQA